MNKSCLKCSTQFEVTDQDLDFYDKVSPVFGGQKFLVPPPSLCPDCRQQRRLAWRNERQLYHQQCTSCQKNFVSIFSPDKKYPVYCHDCWWDDKWDGRNYAQDFDFTRPFFDQWQELNQRVPQLGITNTTPVNSDYCNATTAMKNCYLCFNANLGEDCYYSKGISQCRNVMDCLRIYDSELCYECIDCHQCYETQFLQNCTNCRNSRNCFDCINCQHCLGCAGLRNKEFHIFNQAYSRQEYEQIIRTLSETEVTEKFLTIKLATPHRTCLIQHSENCLGDSIYHSQNAVYCYDVVNTEQIKFCSDLRENNFYAYDITYFGNNLSYAYEAQSCGANLQQCAFVNYCWKGVSNLYYCNYCLIDCEHCFGCTGLKRARYCILNKQYTKEEYEQILPKIIDHLIKNKEWGEFFPAKISPYGYNESVAQEFYQLEKNMALNQGFTWSEYTPPAPSFTKIIPASQLPDKITNVPDDILNWAIECEITGKLYKIIKPELQFYRQHDLPIPRRHPNQRHLDRMQKRNPRKLWTRKCFQCKKELQTTYAPDRPEKVYCEECYLKEVY